MTLSGRLASGFCTVNILSLHRPLGEHFIRGRGRDSGARVIWVSVEPCPSGPAQARLSGRGVGLRWPLGCRGGGGRPRGRLLHHLSCPTIFTWLLLTSPATRGQFSKLSESPPGREPPLSQLGLLTSQEPPSLPPAALGVPASPTSLSGPLRFCSHSAVLWSHSFQRRQRAGAGAGQGHPTPDLLPGP